MSIYTFMQKIAQGTKPPTAMAQQKEPPRGQVYEEGIKPNNLDDNTKRMIERLRNTMANATRKMRESNANSPSPFISPEQQRREREDLKFESEMAGLERARNGLWGGQQFANNNNYWTKERIAKINPQKIQETVNQAMNRNTGYPGGIRGFHPLP